MPYKWLKQLDLPADQPAGGAPQADFIAGKMRMLAGHFKLETVENGKNVRINSRSYSNSTGDNSGVQIKPNQSASSTAGITGLEVSPRFAAGIGGNSLVGIKADPLLKAGSGDLTGAVTAVQANIDFGTSGTRTITGDVSAFESFLAIPSTNTYSGDIAFLRVRTINIKAWDYFLNLDDASTGVETLANGTYTTAQGYLKIVIGSTAVL